MALNLAAIGPAIKERLSPKITKALDNSAETWGRVKQGKANETNNRAAKLVSISANHSIQRATGVEGGAFPNASQLGYSNFLVTYTKLYRTVEVTGDTLAHDTDANSVARFIRDLFMNAAEAMDKWINRMLFGDGTGELARISGINTVTQTVTCAGTINQFGVRKILAGAELEIRSTGGALRNGGAITYIIVLAVDYANDLFTYVAAQGIPSDAVATDIIVDRLSWNTAPHGLAYHIATTGAYQGITRGAGANWANAVVDNEGGATLQASALDKVIMNMKMKIGNLAKKLKSGMEILWSVQETAYELLGYSLKEFNGTNLNMGWTGIAHGNTPVRFDNDVPIDTLYIWYPDSLERFNMPKRKLGVIQVGDQSGPFLQKHDATANSYVDAKQAFLGGFFDFGMRDPRVNALMNGLSIAGLATGRIA